MVSNILKENQNLALRCVAFIVIQVKADTGQVMMQLDQMVSEKFYSSTTKLKFVPVSYIQCQLQMACTDEHSCVQPGNKIWFVLRRNDIITDIVIVNETVMGYIIKKKQYRYLGKRNIRSLIKF